MKRKPVLKRGPGKKNQEKRLPVQIPGEAQRINRILSTAGLTSRRKADEMIRSGRVMLNGRIIRELGSRAVWGVDSIRVNGQEISAPFERVYLMLNKPFGYICSLSDPEGRPTIMDLLEGVKHRVYPVGRLDFDSLGLLLLTNDGKWAHHLTHPRYHVPRTYKVTLESGITVDSLNLLRKGIRLEDGFSGTSKTTLIEKKGAKSVIRITVTVGKNRLVRRMLEAAGCRVIHLVRTGFGALELGNLKMGHFRHLETNEVRGMKKMVGL